MSTIEYEDIYDDAINKIEKGDVDDVYSEIMTREKITLDALKRLRAQKEDDDTNKGVLDTKVSVVIHRTFKTILNVYKDILIGRPLSVIFKSERRIYIGFFLIFLSVCFIILYKV